MTEPTPDAQGNIDISVDPEQVKKGADDNGELVAADDKPVTSDDKAFEEHGDTAGGTGGRNAGGAG